MSRTGFTLLLALLLNFPLQAEPPERFSPIAGRGGKFYTVEEELFFPTWAFGLEDLNDLPLYQEAGFNTLWWPVRWENEETEERAEETLKVAERQGLWVILCLQVGEPLRQPRLLFDYQQRTQQWIQKVVARFCAAPNLLGWALEEEPEACVSFSDPQFRAFLLNLYGSPEDWSAAWSSSEGPKVSADALEKVTQAQALEWSRQWPGGLGLPGLDVAHFQHSTFRDALGLWLGSLQQYDARRPVFTGRLHSFRGILSVPAGYTAAVCDLSPLQTPDDDGSHHALALDCARRGGRTVAVQTLSLAAGTAAFPLEWLPGWVERSLLHGCGGIAWSSWPLLRMAPDARQLIHQVLARSKALMDLTPRGTAAVIVSPEMGGPSPLFSYPNGWDSANPTQLLRAFSQGTRFGPVDFLPPEGLLQDDLTRYGALFLPSAFDLPPLLSERLLEYVRAGGVLVADLGFAARQAGGDLRRLPPAWQEAFGVRQVMRFLQPKPLTEAEWKRLRREQDLQGPMPEGAGLRLSVQNMRFDAHPWLPTIPQDFKAMGVTALPMGLCRLAAGVRPVGTILRRRDYLLTNLTLFGGLTGRRLGQGQTFWASFPLWARWSAAEEGFQRFHAALLARNAHWEVANAEGLYSRPVECLRQGDRWVLRNHSPEQQVVLLRWIGPAQVIYPGGLHFIGATAAPNAASSSSPSGQPASVPPPVAEQWFWCWAEPAGWHDVRPLPWILTGDGVAGVQVVQMDEQHLELRIFGGDAQVSGTSGSDFRVLARVPTHVRLTLTNGPYPIQPHSRHRLEVLTYPRQRPLDVRPLTADERGRLTIEGEWASVVCRLQPSEEE